MDNLNATDSVQYDQNLRVLTVGDKYIVRNGEIVVLPAAAGSPDAIATVTDTGLVRACELVSKGNAYEPLVDALDWAFARCKMTQCAGAALTKWYQTRDLLKSLNVEHAPEILADAPATTLADSKKESASTITLEEEK